MSGLNENGTYTFLVELADDALILGHRLSEWCGHAPILEEDIALTNIALDHVGRANALYQVAAEVEGAGRTVDDLAFLRDASEFRNVNLVELPNGDFAFTILRLFFCSVHSQLLYRALCKSGQASLAGIAGRSIKESTYHVRHCSAWVERLGLGTEESRKRLVHALEELWPYKDELLVSSLPGLPVAPPEVEAGVAAIATEWHAVIEKALRGASLSIPESEPVTMVGQGRKGIHTEFLGHLLAEMQILPRSHPGASW